MKASILLRLILGAMFVSATTVFSAQVTFQVNMSAQTELGNFVPSTDTVFVAGDSLNSWSASASPLAPTTSDTNIWAGTFDVTGTAGATGQYKFVMNNASGTVWEGSVGTGGTTGNRTFTLSDSDQALPVVFFNNVTNTTAVSADVTFQVNMSVEISLGNFDPASGTVFVAGEFNAWNASGFQLTQSTTDTNLWVGTLKLSGTANSLVSYKFVMNGATWEGNVGTNGSQNRTLTLKSTAQTLPVAFFSNLAEVPSNVPITFQVNLGVQTILGNFNPDTDTVYVAGDLLNNWSASTSALTRSTTASNEWTGTFDIQGTTGTVMYYKFVLNGATWESIDNRAYTFTGTNAQTLPMVYFNNAAGLGKISTSSITNNQLTLTWTANALVQLQKATSLGGTNAWEIVPNTLGQSSATVPVDNGQAFFRLAIP